MPALTAERRQQLIKRGGELYRASLSGGRELTTAEKDELVRIEAEIDSAEYHELSGETTPAERRFASAVEVRGRPAREGEVRVYKRGEKMADDLPTYDGPGLGALVKARAGLGNEEFRRQFRDMNEGSGPSGQFLVPVELAAREVDLLRNTAQVFRAGSEAVPLPTPTFRMARLEAPLTPAWKPEGAPLSYSTQTYEEILFQSHTLVAGCKVSVELLEDANGLDALISNDIAKALGLQLDYAALYGTGPANNSPLGIKNQPGVTLTPVNAAPVNWKPLSTAITTLLGHNLPGPFGAIYNAHVAGEFDNLYNTLGDPLKRPPLVEEMEDYISNQIPSGPSGSPLTLTPSDIFVGQWDQCMIGIRTALALEVSRVAGDTTGSAFSNLQVWYRAYLRADVQLRHPQAFTVLTGIQ